MHDGLASLKPHLPRAPLSLPQALSFAHLVTWGAWVGSIFYTTFVAGVAMFKSLSRQTFRDVQEVLFPAFFATCTAWNALLLALAPLVLRSSSPGAAQLLAVSLAATLANLLYLEPATTRVMLERAALERMSNPIASGVYPQGKDAAMKALGKRFGALHGASSAANLVALVVAVVYGWRFM